MVYTNKRIKGKSMLEHNEEIRQLAEEFENCQKILLALGDENRQHLMLEMLRMGQCTGVRVGAITEKSNLSRPTVSHHIRILKDAGTHQKNYGAAAGSQWWRSMSNGGNGK